MSDQEYIDPLDIAIDPETKTLKISWSDGQTNSYHWDYLRWMCPCAMCAGEGGMPGMLSTAKTLSDRQRTLLSWQPVGRYGLNLKWGDNHNTGIYTFDTLIAKRNDPAYDQPGRPTQAGQR